MNGCFKSKPVLGLMAMVMLVGAIVVLLGSSSVHVYARGPGGIIWTPTNSMQVARVFHTATLLPNGQVLVAGGTDSSGDQASAELYNPSTGTWTTTGSMNEGRYYHAATLISNGQVLVTGGFGSSNNPLASAELYNPSTGIWTTIGSMRVARGYHTATLLLNRQVLVAGGSLGSTFSALASAETGHLMGPP